MQLMQHELGWDVVNCYGEWDGGVSNLGRDGKRRSSYSLAGWSSAPSLESESALKSGD